MRLKWVKGNMKVNVDESYATFVSSHGWGVNERDRHQRLRRQ